MIFKMDSGPLDGLNNDPLEAWKKGIKKLKQWQICLGV